MTAAWVSVCLKEISIELQHMKIFETEISSVANCVIVSYEILLKHSGKPVMQIKTVTFLQVLIFRYDLHCEKKSVFQGMQWFSMICLRPLFFDFLIYQFFSEQVRVGGRNKNKNNIHSDFFPIELKSKETQNRVSFILFHLENGSNEFYF